MSFERDYRSKLVKDDICDMFAVSYSILLAA
jgi:hypothetical protein